MKTKINIVQNTHWDYEWYFTNDQSSVLFEFFMKELLEALELDKLDYFILDGQMGIVEKYLESYPEDSVRIKSLNESGKLSIGPWFTQTDQMIISQESIVRNLLTGHKIASELGGAWKMAYVPDAFGQSANMPKIYDGFGIDKMVFWRGLSDSKCESKEINWKSEDGSNVNAINIPEGYYSGGAIYWASDDDLESILQGVIKNSQISEESVLSLGGDQRYVDLDIRDKITELNSKQDKYEFGLGRYEDYFKKFESANIPTVEGEMLDSQDSKIHRSIYSHRYDHKYLNDKMERMITRIAEPLAAMADSVGVDAHLNIIDMGWRLLLLNSAHDSAGGCNSDITNEHILNRFKRVEELITSYIDIVIRKISETAYEENELVLFNTSHIIKNSWSNISIITKGENFMLEDDGTEVDYDLVSKEKVYYGSINRDEKDNDPDLYYYKSIVNFKKQLKPLSYNSVKVTEVIKEKIIKQSDIARVVSDRFDLKFVDGAFNLFDKETETHYNDFINLIADADDGDTYDFSPLPNSKRIKLKFKDHQVITNDFNYSKEMKIKGKIELCKDIDQWTYNVPQLVEQDFELSISLEDGFLRIKANTFNIAKDIRIRIEINSGIDFAKVNSNIHYGFISRDIVQPEVDNWKDLGWKEEPTGIYPLLSNMYVKDANKQMSVFVNGIKEYEVLESGKIELTLFRSIGWLGKPDLIRRPGKASGQEFKYIPTPDSQLLNQKMEWEIGIMLDELSEANVMDVHTMKMNECVYYQNQELDRFTGPLKYFVSNKWKYPIKKDASLFEKIEISDDVEISIIKQLDDKRTLIRMVNHSDSTIEEPMIIKDPSIKKAWESNLLEEQLEEIEFDSMVGLKVPLFKKRRVKTIILGR